MKPKSKKEKNYSVIIVSGATSSSKEFVISSKLIRNSIIAFIFLLLIFGFIIFDYLTISFDKEKMKRLERDNTEKESTIDSLSKNIQDIQIDLKEMSTYQKKISVAMGLTSPDALTEIGMGGGVNTSNSSTISNIPSSLEINGKESSKTNINTEKDIFSRENILKTADDISQEAKKINGSLKFIENVMQKQKVRLAHTPSVWPTKGYLTSPIGWRIHPMTGKRDYHNGQDIATQFGNKVMATADGVVLVAEHWNYLGNLVIIDHNFGFTTRYGHMASLNVKEGDRVKRFDVIGYVGNSGRSSAPHLHYEIRYFDKPINPVNFIID